MKGKTHLSSIWKWNGKLQIIFYRYSVSTIQQHLFNILFNFYSCLLKFNRITISYNYIQLEEIIVKACYSNYNSVLFWHLLKRSVKLWQNTFIQYKYICLYCFVTITWVNIHKRIMLEIVYVNYAVFLLL